jgi:hypothetical protein
MQCSHRVLEPAVVCGRIDKACKTELSDIPQTLEPWVLNEIKYQVARDAYEAINRIVDQLSFVGTVSHSAEFEIQK